MNKTRKAIIFGTGSFSELAHYCLENDSEYEVCAFSISEEFLDKKKQMGLPLIGFENIEKTYDPNEYDMFIAVGYNKMNKIREGLCDKAREKGYNLLSYISTHATVLTSDIGDNCFVFEDNTIQPFVKIGNNTILWSGNHIGHHSRLANNVWVCSHVVISGHCEIEDNCFIGVNATLRDGLTIAKKTLIGAGTLIMKDTKPKEVYSQVRTKVFSKNVDEIGF